MVKNLVAKYFYKDVAQIYRPANSGWGRGENELVLENVPCHLSQTGTKSTAHSDDRSQKMFENLRLNVLPETEIHEGDIAIVNHQGQVFRLVTGFIFEYSTHKMAECYRRREGGEE